MSGKEILEIVDILPKLLIYLLPGVLFIKIIEYQLSVNRSENKFKFIYYILVSYIFINVGELISKFRYGYFDIYTSEFTFGTIVLSIVIGYGVGLFLKSDVSLDALRFFKIYRTNNSSIFADIKDIELGTWVKVYLNDDKIVYSGAFREYENSFDYDKTFIILSSYISYSYAKYAKNDIDECIFVNDRNKTQWVAIKVKNINRLEIDYSAQSKKLKEIK
ncbi:hypothetical protein psyc5s11_53490 [Clostridium gelidum]|uniref:Uncharacterized protein n=1 Tax=Clostridium gelidum TaxID=704125 RepID=A0ABN6J4S6_9CLOT|nr:hypothetical protein [Clostridium gelidum]BCZ49282.1 hypothetical protein psyc5s11_53490 [Clostridium gelidum]